MIHPQQPMSAQLKQIPVNLIQRVYHQIGQNGRLAQKPAMVESQFASKSASMGSLTNQKLARPMMPLRKNFVLCNHVVRHNSKSITESL